jgi:hypothetical protein
MFYGRYTHIKEILEKVREEFGFEDVPVDAAMEHTWMALGKLGVSNFLEDFDEEILIEDNRGLMPNNVMVLEGIRDKNSQIILTPSKDIFISSVSSATASSETYISSYTVTSDEPDDVVGVYNQYATLTPNYANIEYYPELSNLNTGSSIGYQIRGDYIFCELAECTLEIKYKGFPIWDDNTPKIPDDPKVIDFMINYIGEKIAKKMYLMDKLSRDKFEMIKQDRMWSQGEARNKLLAPDDNEMEFIRRMLVRLTPVPEKFNSGFKYLGERERRR